MAVDWKEFERLVARIEQTVAPSGAVVKSPDFITDLVTGSRRQIDATIRYHVGTVPILITVECRKHDDVQDDTWLEQVAMKKQKVGAAKTIAVSSSGFTNPAKKTASMNGIEVRTIAEISANDIIDWLRIRGVERVVCRREFVSFQWDVYGSGTAHLHPDIVQQMEQNAVATPVIVRVADGEKVSVEQILAAASQNGPDLFQGVPADGVKVRRVVPIEIADQTLSILTTTGPRFLKLLLLGLDVWVERTFMPIGDGFEYTNTQTALLRGAEKTIDLPFGHECQLTLCKESGSDQIKITIATRKKPEK